MESVLGAKILIHNHPAKVRKFDETIVLVHHMLGSHRTTVRHRHWLTSLGYNCVSFDLIFGSSNPRSSFNLMALRATTGVFRMWRAQITKVLDQIEGRKIVYGFSGPNLAALLACQPRTDVLKFICDGGPFDCVEENTRNLFRIELKVTNPIQIKIFSRIGAFLWGKDSVAKLHESLGVWKNQVPILSVRGAVDPIVPEKTINMIFDKHPNLPLTKFSLPQGKHLDGLKQFPELYKAEVSRFLASQHR